MGKIQELYAAADALLTNMVDIGDEVADVDEETAIERGYHKDEAGNYWYHDAWDLKEALAAVTQEDVRRADEGLDWVNNLHDYYAREAVVSGLGAEAAASRMIRDTAKPSDPPQWIRHIAAVHHAMLPHGIVRWDDVDRLLGGMTVTIWVMHWSYDGQEGSEVFFSEEEANAAACELFGVEDTHAITQAYEDGKWKAFGVDKYTFRLADLLDAAARQRQQPTEDRRDEA